jgi:glutamate-1-semialdehyde 2,1-aminomutase
MSDLTWGERARDLFPGGVNSPVRAFRNVGAEPFFVKRAEGARLWTEDGKELVDWIGSWGPMVVGHLHPAVTAAIQEALLEGSSFGACSRREVELGEEIRARVPSCERMRLVSSGTEATMSALRLARGFTGRDKVVKFRGCYHGHADSFLIAAGSGALTFGNPSSPGVTEGTARDTLVAEYNDLPAVEALFAANPGQIACVIVEPVAGNMGLVVPQPGYLEGLQRLCRENGALFVVDEVMTGFRLARGGAVERLGLSPDLVTLGKIAGGGLPLAVFGGRREVMERLSPLGPVYQAGTLSGNPLACAAGLATLRLLDDALYARLEAKGELLERELRRNLPNLPLRVQRMGSMLTVFFHPGPVLSMREVDSCDKEAFGRFFRGMLEEGHFLPPAQFEAFFVSDAHSEADLLSLAEAAGRQARLALGL